MAQVVRFYGPRKAGLIEVSDQTVGPHEVRVRTLYSGVSAGTELTAYRGSNPYMHKHWDRQRRLFVDGRSTFGYPVDGWGYEEVGEIQEAGEGVQAVTSGDLVYGTWGHRSGVVLPESQVEGRTLPSGLDPLLGIFSHIGAIALNAVLDADIHVGEQVAVFGQGPPGLIASQLARLNGGTVTAVDTISQRLELAKRTGAMCALDARTCSAAEEIKRLTWGRGADVSLELSGNHQALHQAIRATAYSSRVVAAGFFQGEAVDLSLGEEFHHNRVHIVGSQISGVAPHLSHRWDTLRLQRTVMDLAAEGRLELHPLVTHIVPAAHAGDAFHLLDTQPDQVVQVVLEFEK